MTGSDLARTGDAAVSPARVPARGYAVDLVAAARQAEAAKELGATLIRSGLLPRAIAKPEEAMAVMLTGQELDLSPMFALKNVTVIQGTPALSEQAIGLLIRRAGHKVRVIESTDESCTVEGVRADDPGHPQRVTFSIADARKAGLTGKNSWKNYTRAMLRARAKSELGRAMFEDALAGLVYTPEELGADVDGDGQIVEHAPVRELKREDPAKPEPAKAALGHAPGRVADGLTDWERDQQVEAPEEAEVVEEPASEKERGDVLRSQVARIENLSEWIWGDKRAVEAKVLKGHRIEELSEEAAKGVISGLQRTKERVQAGEEEDPRGEQADEAEPAPHPDEVEGVERGGALGGDSPATDAQVEQLRSLAADVVEDGVARFEEMIQKPIEELTRDEASEWLNRLSGRQP